MDLRCWMALATRAMATMGYNMQRPKEGEREGGGGGSWVGGVGGVDRECMPVV